MVDPQHSVVFEGVTPKERSDYTLLASGEFDIVDGMLGGVNLSRDADAAALGRTKEDPSASALTATESMGQSGASPSPSRSSLFSMRTWVGSLGVHATRRMNSWEPSKRFQPN